MEVAANVGEAHPEKRVVLVQSGPVLMPRVKNAHGKIMKRMEELGVEVHLNERVVEFDDMLREYTTDVGNVFQAGKVYRAAPCRTRNSSKTRGPIPTSAALDARGFCKVDDYCQLRGFENIYAGGDILEDRMFASSGEHVIPERNTPNASPGRRLCRRVHRQEHRAESRRRTERRGELVYVQEGQRHVRRRSRGVFGSQTSFSVIHPVMADVYESKNFGWGIPRDELERDNCGLSPAVAGVKSAVSA